MADMGSATTDTGKRTIGLDHDEGLFGCHFVFGLGFFVFKTVLVTFDACIGKDG